MKCSNCGQHRHPRITGYINPDASGHGNWWDVDTMNPRSPLDWACIVGGALIVLLLPLALVVYAGAVTL